MIRRHGKARWSYECRACGYTSPYYPDHFRALEDCQRHERNLRHAVNAVGEALRPIGWIRGIWK